jgi:hypothetical protein
MAEIIATIDGSSSGGTTATVQETGIVLTSTDLSNPAVVESMENIADIDVATNGKQNGSILVYRTITNKWTSTTTLDAQDMEGGEF